MENSREEAIRYFIDFLQGDYSGKSGVIRTAIPI